MVDIEDRSTWGAQHGTGSPDPGPEPRVVIHHSFRPALEPDATREQERNAVRGIERFHVENNGWSGIGYNFLVAPSGRVYEGRGWQFRGAHAGPVNGESIGVCLLIDGQVTEPNDATVAAVRALIAAGIQKGEISADYVLSGHRDHMQRTCPGDLVYARLQEFRHDAAGAPSPPSPTPPEPSGPSDDSSLPEPDVDLVDSLAGLSGSLDEVEPVVALRTPVRALVAATAGPEESTRDFLFRLLGRVLDR